MNLLYLFHDDGSSELRLTGRDIAVLETIRLHDGICTADIISFIEKESGKSPRVATVYETILSLKKKNLIFSDGLGISENGGRPRKYFKITEVGELALQVIERMKG